MHLRAEVQLGWLWMDRFRGLAGLGIYVRPSYTVEGGLTGLFARPSDRDPKKSDKDDTESRFSCSRCVMARDARCWLGLVAAARRRLRPAVYVADLRRLSGRLERPD